MGTLAVLPGCQPFRQIVAMLIHKLAVNPQGVRGYATLVDSLPEAVQASDAQPALALFTRPPFSATYAAFCA